MGRINVLPESVANKIAAGEVVTRPASVVKELVENALDAGAKSISVSIEKAGKKLIEVSDDGSGIDEEDIEKVFLRHATSKISRAEDLQNILTLGFRGEALAATASVTKIELITKPKTGGPAAVRAVFEGGRKVSMNETTHNTGTTIRIRDLFYNTPARLKFMKSDFTEESHVIETVTAAGLANPDIYFRLIVNGKEIVLFPHAASLKERIRIIHGKDIYKNLVELKHYTDSIKVTGYAVKPSITKSNRSSQYIFMNKRPITDKRLAFAVYDGYGTLLMKGRYPIIFLFLDVEPSMVDVNVHPSKAEVRFRDEKAVFSAVRQAVSTALGGAELTVEGAPRDTAVLTQDRPGLIRNTGRPLEEAYKKSIERSVREFFTEETPALFEDKTVRVEKPPAQPVDVVSSKKGFLSLRALGQIRKTYIVGEDKDSLVVIDQHAAHEKVLYEAIIRGINTGGIKMQEMLIPEVFEVTPGEKPVIENSRDVFEKCGFVIEQFGESEYKVSAHPVLVKDGGIGPLVKEIAELIKDKGNASAEEVLKDIAATMACRAAVKAGDSLPHEEIEGLLNRYFEADEPFSCPHGRPPIVKISFNDIEKMFKRKL